jgi:sacsin
MRPAISLAAGGDVEAFGQSEALTKRIARILEQYPDGPNILSELIQNADDAGATRVRVLYNHATYGSATLFSPAMAKWQGPALYCVRVRACRNGA